MNIGKYLKNSLSKTFFGISVGEYLLVAGALLLTASVLTRGLIFHLQTHIFTGGIGDATGGFLWLIFADKGLNPSWAHTNLINYPYGQALGNPIFITWSLVLYPLWLISRFLSPVAALNIMMFLGFISCGLVTYAFIKRLTGSWYVSAFASFATAFMPYHIFKSETHLTNIFSWVFVAIIASSVAFWRNPTKKRSILLAASISAAIYTDGYFVFVAGVLCGALFVALLLTELASGFDLASMARRLKGLVLVFVTTLSLLLPVVVTQLTSHDQIQQGLSNDRSNIKQEVAFYAAKPMDFLLPPGGNFLVGHYAWFQKLENIQQKRSNNLENTNYIGYTILILDAMAAVYLILKTKSLNRKKAHGPLPLTYHVMAVCLIAAPLVLIWSLPPHIFGVKMPIDYLTDYIAYWRVPARLILAFQPLLAIPAALALYIFFTNHRFSTRKMVILTLLLTSILALEFTSDIYKTPFGFSNMPKAYSWLASRPVHAVAEVPFVDRPTEITGYYIFAQMIHEKPIVNNQLSTLAPGQYNTMGDLTNPETINFFRSRGADVVIDHTQGGCKSVTWGMLIYDENHVLSPPFMDGVATHLCMYRLSPQSNIDPYFAYAKKGFQNIDYRDKNVRYWLIFDGPSGQIEVVDSQGRQNKEAGKAAFSAQLSFVGDAPDKLLNWQIKQNGVIVASGAGRQSTTMQAIIDSTQPVDINISTDENHRAPTPGELDMRNVQVERVSQ